jgi:hypothetical protein
MKEIVKKFDRGDALTDKEVNDLYKFFIQLETSLFTMGETFWLARCVITRNLHSIEGYKTARNI